MRSFAFALLLALVPSVAGAAAHTVALIGVSGPRGEKFAQRLSTSLAELYEVVPGDLYLEAATRLNQRSASPEAVHAVARALHVDGVIAGSVAGGKLRIVVRDGATGEVVVRKDYPLRGRAALQLVDHVLADLVRALEHVGSKSTPSVEPQPNVAEEEPDTTSPAGRESEGDLVITRSAERLAIGASAISFAAGFALIGRTLAFDVAGAPGQSGGFVEAITLRGTVFPLALAPEVARAHPVAAAFGLNAIWERSLNATASQGATSSFPSGSSSAAVASRWRVLLVGRIPLARSGATLDIESGLAALNYAYMSTRDLNVPDVDYQALDGGLSLRLPLGTRRVMLDLRAAGLVVVDAGNIAAITNYGQGQGSGFDADGGVEAWLAPWLWVRASGYYTRIDMSFGGSGMRLAHSSSDSWYGGVLEVGSAM